MVQPTVLGGIIDESTDFTITILKKIYSVTQCHSNELSKSLH